MAELDSPTPVSTSSQPQEISNLTKEAKSRVPKPGSRLQELEHELAKIHQKTPNVSAASQSVMYANTSTVQPVNSVPVATVAPSVVTPVTENSGQMEAVDNAGSNVEVGVV